MNVIAANNVDEYINGFPKETQILLQQVRNCILKAAPNAEELISYRMPAYKENGILVYFAGYKNHIGFYPTASGVEAFENELIAYKKSKGTIQFSLDKKIPFTLITKIVKFKVRKNLGKKQKK